MKASASVFASKQYSRFKLHPANRGIVKSHVNMLAKSLEEHGWLNSFPMTVKKNGKGFIILDGHNRLFAAKQLDIPVKYTVITGEFKNNELAFLNSTQKRWSAADFIHSYANLDYKDYKVLEDFMDEYNVGVGVASALLTKGHHSAKAINSGQFKVVDEKWAADRIHWLIQINNVLPFSAMKKNFVNAFVACCRIEDFSPMRLHDQIKKNPAHVLDLSLLKDMARCLEEVYNHQLQQKNRVPLAFLIEQARMK